MADKLTDKRRKTIVADYAVCQNYREVARKHGISPSTVRNIVLKDTDAVQLCTQKEIENTEDTLAYMQGQHDIKKRIIDKLLIAIEQKTENLDMFTNVKDLMTAYGIMVDKELKFAEVKYLFAANKGDGEIDGLSASLMELAGDMDAD